MGGKITSHATVPLNPSCFRITPLLMLQLPYKCGKPKKENDLLPSTVPLSPGVASHWQAVEQMLTQFCQYMYRTCPKCTCFKMYMQTAVSVRLQKTSLFVIFPFETEK